jgi:hypothetical protein
MHQHTGGAARTRPKVHSIGTWFEAIDLNQVPILALSRVSGLEEPIVKSRRAARIVDLLITSDK